LAVELLDWHRYNPSLNGVIIMLVFFGWLLGVLTTLAVLALAANDGPVKLRDPRRKHFTKQLHAQLRQDRR
jgi:hypothetical protein